MPRRTGPGGGQEVQRRRVRRLIRRADFGEVPDQPAARAGVEAAQVARLTHVERRVDMHLEERVSEQRSLPARARPSTARRAPRSRPRPPRPPPPPRAPHGAPARGDRRTRTQNPRTTCGGARHRRARAPSAPAPADPRPQAERSSTSGARKSGQPDGDRPLPGHVVCSLENATILATTLIVFEPSVPIAREIF